MWRRRIWREGYRRVIPAPASNGKALRRGSSLIGAAAVDQVVRLRRGRRRRGYGREEQQSRRRHPGYRKKQLRRCLITSRRSRIHPQVNRLPRNLFFMPDEFFLQRQRVAVDGWAGEIIDGEGRRRSRDKLKRLRQLATRLIIRTSQNRPSLLVRSSERVFLDEFLCRGSTHRIRKISATRPRSSPRTRGSAADQRGEGKRGTSGGRRSRRMLLRSSSTPIFGSLLASSSSSSPYFSESPNHGPVPNPLERAHSDSHNKLFFPPNPSNHNHHHHQLNSSSSFHGCSLHLSSPVVDPPVGFRRVQSEGNLQNLAATDLPPPAKSHRRPSPVLETIPSFSLYSSRLERGLEDSVAEEEDELEEEEVAEDSSEFVPRSFAGEKGKAVTMGSPLFLAKGLGLENFGAAASSELILGMGGTGSNGGGGGGVGGRSVHVDSSGSQADMEAYYKKMVEEDPGNSLLLRNYAQFLHKSKGDLKRAEEYYSRAVLAEPGDGEVLSHYAKVIWELHHDRGRAGGYFEQAVQAAPQNSHVLASYANFLWETEDDEEEEGEKLEEEFGGDKVPVMAHPRSLSC